MLLFSRSSVVCSVGIRVVREETRSSDTSALLLGHSLAVLSGQACTAHACTNSNEEGKRSCYRHEQMRAVTSAGSHPSSVPAPPPETRRGAGQRTGDRLLLNRGPSQTAFPHRAQRSQSKRRDVAALHKACPCLHMRPGNLATQPLWASAPHLHPMFRFPLNPPILWLPLASSVLIPW